MALEAEQLEHLRYVYALHSELESHDTNCNTRQETIIAAEANCQAALQTQVDISSQNRAKIRDSMEGQHLKCRERLQAAAKAKGLRGVEMPGPVVWIDKEVYIEKVVYVDKEVRKRAKNNTRVSEKETEVESGRREKGRERNVLCSVCAVCTCIRTRTYMYEMYDV